jgi:hypothetical protein
MTKDILRERNVERRLAAAQMRERVKAMREVHVQQRERLLASAQRDRRLASEQRDTCFPSEAFGRMRPSPTVH